MPQPSLESLIPQVTGNLAGPQNIILFILIIAVFVIAYKVLKLILETGLMSFLSVIYLFVLRYFGIGPEITISNIILFAFLGGFLYLVYYLIASSIALIMIPVKIVGKIFKSIGGSISGHLARKRQNRYAKQKTSEKKRESKKKSKKGSKENSKDENEGGKGDKGDEEEKKTSEVVLERMKKRSSQDAD